MIARAEVIATPLAIAGAWGRRIGIPFVKGILVLAAIATLACVALGLTLGCGAAQKAGEQFIDCLEADAKAKVPDLLPAVEAILVGGIKDWRGQLEALGAYAGEDALACAVQAAQQSFANKVGGQVGSPAAAGLSNAAAAIAEHGWRFR